MPIAHHPLFRRLGWSVLIGWASFAQAEPQLHSERVQKALVAEAAQRTEEALALFLEAEQTEPQNPFILQNIAQAYSDSIVDITDRDEKSRRAQLTLDYAKRAVKLDPNNAVNVLSVAIAHGRLATYSDTRTKVDYSRLIKADAERALELDPNYAWAHHLLGRWHYEIASLGSVARWFAKLIYGGLPDASFAEAESHLKRAIDLDPGNLIHRLELGFVYKAEGREADARREFEIGLSMPSNAKHDDIAKVRARAAL
jgi:tetratricopeptide (TPR) repeat protein